MPSAQALAWSVASMIGIVDIRRLKGSSTPKVTLLQISYFGNSIPLIQMTMTITQPHHYPKHIILSTVNISVEDPIVHLSHGRSEWCHVEKHPAESYIALPHHREDPRHRVEQGVRRDSSLREQGRQLGHKSSSTISCLSCHSFHLQRESPPLLLLSKNHLTGSCRVSKSFPGCLVLVPGLWQPHQAGVERENLFKF